MKALIAISLMTLAAAGCRSAHASVDTSEAAAVHAHVVGLRMADEVVNPLPAPELRCGGDRVITHGDGHTTPCPGCVDCRSARAEIIEAAELLEPIDQGGPLLVALAPGCAEGRCTPRRTPGASTGPNAGSCATGSCGATGGPVRNLIARRPLRRAAAAWRERRPVRRLLGRLFGRGC